MKEKVERCGGGDNVKIYEKLFILFQSCIYVWCVSLEGERSIKKEE